MQAAISHSGGTDVIVFENFPTKSGNFVTTMENITRKNFKPAVRTEAIKVKVHVLDQFDTYNPIQLEERKYLFAPLMAAILVLPLLETCGSVFHSASPSRLHLWTSHGGTFWLGWLWCGGHHGNSTAFAVLVAVYGWSTLWFTTRSTSRRRRVHPPLPYCGFEALVKIEFDMVDMCMERSDAVTVAIANGPTYLPRFWWVPHVANVAITRTMADRGDPLPHPMTRSDPGPGFSSPSSNHGTGNILMLPVVAGHALARVVLEDLPHNYAFTHRCEI